MSLQIVTLLEEFGGLSVTDRFLQNMVLILKWLWVALADNESLWLKTLSCLGIMLHRGDLPSLATRTSHFIRDLHSFFFIFHLSI
jgi:hypothetical protein